MKESASDCLQYDITIFPRRGDIIILSSMVTDTRNESNTRSFGEEFLLDMLDSEAMFCDLMSWCYKPDPGKPEYGRLSG